MTSGSPNVAQPSPNRSVRGAKLSSVTVLVDCSIAIDPIKYIGIPFSFDDFKPDSNIIDNDGMPGKPSVPACSVFGSYSHFMILSFGSRMKRTEELRAGDRPDQVVSWIFFVPIIPDIASRKPQERCRRHAAVSVAFSVAVGYHNLNLRFEQSPRPLRRGTGGNRLGAPAASPVHE
jgi:hypothetical protein